MAIDLNIPEFLVCSCGLIEEVWVYVLPFSIACMFDVSYIFPIRQYFVKAADIEKHTTMLSCGKLVIFKSHYYQRLTIENQQVSQMLLMVNPLSVLTGLAIVSNQAFYFTENWSPGKLSGRLGRRYCDCNKCLYGGPLWITA